MKAALSVAIGKDTPAFNKWEYLLEVYKTCQNNHEKNEFS